MALNYRKWKHAMRRYAHQHRITIPEGFNPDSPRFGPPARELIARTKHSMGLHPVDGTFTWPLEQRLKPYVDQAITIPPWRTKAGDLMATSVRRNAEWWYRQIRAYQLTWTPGRRCLTDCSGGVSLVAYMSGMENPSGPSYPWGYGNTATILAHLSARRLSGAAAAHVGDYAYWNGHICMVARRGNDPVLWSHGMDAGPILIYASIEDRYHPGSPIWLPGRGR